MKKLLYLWIAAVILLAACATKLRIGDLELDTHTLPKDSVVIK